MSPIFTDVPTGLLLSVKSEKSADVYLCKWFAGLICRKHAPGLGAGEHAESATQS